MQNRWTPLRTLRLIALLIQLALPSLGAVADAHLELESVAQPTHVESQSHDCDSRGHPPDCAICHYLRSGIVASGSRPLLLPDGEAPAIAAAAAPTPRAGQRLHLPARAPPLFS
jgi:hypothetical protein